jgi:Ca2+-binding RTX toxin-like protein
MPVNQRALPTVQITCSTKTFNHTRRISMTSPTNAPVERKTKNGTLFEDRLTLTATEASSFAWNMSGFEGRDLLEAGQHNDQLNGHDDSDTLKGFDGNDTLDGGQDTDHMYGGRGNDEYYLDRETDLIFENPGEGRDTIYSSAPKYTLAPNVEFLRLINNAEIGIGNNEDNTIYGNPNRNSYIYGSGGNDQLVGGDKNDFLYGGLGRDTLTGGKGNDTYMVDDTLDVVDERQNGGTDTVESWIQSYRLTTHTENLKLHPSFAQNGQGNALNNLMEGNDLGNTFEGFEGNDTLYGRGGHDTLIGGDGNDSLYGEADADTLEGAALSRWKVGQPWKIVAREKP